MLSESRAVVLLSGGLDSTTCLAMARDEGQKCHALAFDYGQRHDVELKAATELAQALGAEEIKIFHLDLRQIGHSALTADIPVPRAALAERPAGQIPITYVPGRNTIFLSVALAWAEVLGAGNIYIGVNALDYSGYPDCRPAFIKAYQIMAHLATKTGVDGTAPITIHTPLINMSKAEIIRTGAKLGVDYSLTHSCYDPNSQGLACGQCDSCILRKRGFEEAGIMDPTKYA